VVVLPPLPLRVTEKSRRGFPFLSPLVRGIRSMIKRLRIIGRRGIAPLRDRQADAAVGNTKSQITHTLLVALFSGADISDMSDTSYKFTIFGQKIYRLCKCIGDKNLDNIHGSGACKALSS
jgi:hypothetical protein